MILYFRQVHLRSRRRVIETSSDVAQVKLIPQLVAKVCLILQRKLAHHTAIVLADENLLMPVLTSLPENIGDINITMGYPLKQSLVYTLMRASYGSSEKCFRAEVIA